MKYHVWISRGEIERDNYSKYNCCKYSNDDYKLRDCNEEGVKYDVCKDETTVIYDPGNLSKLP